MLLKICALLFPSLAFAGATLSYSSYLRDNFTPNAIATDSTGAVYLAGNMGAVNATAPTTILVIKLDPKTNQVLYTRFIGGSVSDSANALAVDSGGNAYIAGNTASPDFPITTGGNLGTPPTALSDRRSFVMKLDPAGNVVYSDLIGATAATTALALAVTPAGQAVVTGTVQSAGLTPTPGAYAAPVSNGHPFLMELDPTGKKIVFTATGIGGSALALDSSGNIYIAGTTFDHIYPTTHGAYQEKFPDTMLCEFPCQLYRPGGAQNVTKVDPTGSRLIYSTALTGGALTNNGGIAVDQTGAVYVTGYTSSGEYPFSVTPPAVAQSTGSDDYLNGLPFLTKLDASGQKVLFSVPVGGNGVQVDSAGNAYVTGLIGLGAGAIFSIANNLPVLSDTPASCLPNTIVIKYSGYVAKADGTSGAILDKQFIGGSKLNPTATALSVGVLWLSANTAGPDVPMTPGSLINAGPQGAGAYLGAVDFSQVVPLTTPQISCVLDNADLAPLGGVNRYQLLSIFGTGLGPAVGVAAQDYSTTQLGGISVNFNDTPAILLYVSATQINLAVPDVLFLTHAATMQVTVSGVTAAPLRQFPLSGPAHMFLNFPETYKTPQPFASNSLSLLALNSDGTVNSPSNLAKLGTQISVFINGLSPSAQGHSNIFPMYAIEGLSVAKVSQPNPFVLQVDLQTPSSVDLNSPPPGASCTLHVSCEFRVHLIFGDGSPVANASFNSFVYEAIP